MSSIKLVNVKMDPKPITLVYRCYHNEENVPTSIEFFLHVEWHQSDDTYSIKKIEFGECDGDSVQAVLLRMGGWFERIAEALKLAKEEPVMSIPYVFDRSCYTNVKHMKREHGLQVLRERIATLKADGFCQQCQRPWEEEDCSCGKFDNVPGPGFMTDIWNKFKFAIEEVDDES
jgi:hypothetical protein